MTMDWPVMNDPAFEARNTAAPAISSGSLDTAQGRAGGRALERIGILPQRAREVRFHQPRRDAVGANVIRPVFHRDVARELEVRRLGDAIGTDHGRAAQASDGGDDDDGTVFPLLHLRQHHLAEPVVGFHIGAHDLVEGLVGDVHLRAVIGIERRVADQNVDASPFLARLVHEVLDLLLVVDVARYRDCDLRTPCGIDVAWPPCRRRRPCGLTRRPSRRARPAASRRPRRCPWWNR